MTLVLFNNQEPYDEDKINLLWKLYRLVRELNEKPLIWKLTDPFLDAIGQFFHESAHDALVGKTFLDSPVDQTSMDPRLICEQNTYPIFVVMHGA